MSKLDCKIGFAFNFYISTYNIFGLFFIESYRLQCCPKCSKCLNICINICYLQIKNLLFCNIKLLTLFFSSDNI